MQKTRLFPNKLMLILFFFFLSFSVRANTMEGQSQERMPTKVEVSMPNLPVPYVLNDSTLTEALDAFFKWYKNVYPPMEQTISVVVSSESPDDNDKRKIDSLRTEMDPFSDSIQRSEGKIIRTVDLSGVPVGDAIPKIAGAFGLIAYYYNGLYHIDRSEIATRGVMVGAEKKLSSSSYLASFLTSNIVAAVVGYETTRQLSRSIKVPVFSAEAFSATQSVYGILFKIVAPSKYADKFFWIQNTAHDEWSSPTILYNSNLLYSFRRITGPEQFGAISESEFFSIPARMHFSSTTWSKGVPFLKDTNDVTVTRSFIDKHILALSNKVEQSFSRLKLINKGTKEYDTGKTLHDMALKDLNMACERRKELLKNAAEQLESNQQMLNILFPVR